MLLLDLELHPTILKATNNIFQTILGFCKSTDLLSRTIDSTCCVNVKKKNWRESWKSQDKI